MMVLLSGFVELFDSSKLTKGELSSLSNEFVAEDIVSEEAMYELADN